MTDRELLQQALDMLDDINQCSLPPTGIPLPAEIDHVMEALRARLAQPECKWVDLTNDEIDDIWAEFNDGYGIIEETLWGYERALEAKLREKNG
jgi:hypothetical protein